MKPAKSKITTQLKRSWVICKKDLFIYYLKENVIVFGLLMPLFMFLSFAVNKGYSYQFLLPRLLGLVLYFTGSAIGPIIAPWESRMKTLERLLAAPVAIAAIIFGDVIASFMFGLLASVVVIVFSIFLLGFSILSWQLLAAIVLGSFCFACIGLLISVPPTDRPSETMVINTLIKFPLLFISGVFVPIDQLGVLKSLAYFSPLTYVVDAARTSYGLLGHFPVAASLFRLTVFSILLFLLAVFGHSRTMRKRV